MGFFNLFYSADRPITKESAKFMMGDIKIPSCMDSIPDRLFENNHFITSVIIPGTVKVVGDSAFKNCKKLRSVILEEGIEELGSGIFSGCEKLFSLTVPDSLRYCSALTFTDTYFKAPVLNRSGSKLFNCSEAAAGKEWTVPSSVKEIFNWACHENKLLEKVILPEGLEYIASGAFSYSNLKEVIFLGNKCFVSTKAFTYCTSLRKVTAVHPGIRFAEGAFLGCKWLNKMEGQSMDTDVFCHMKGVTFLSYSLKEEETPNHKNDPEFKALTASCAVGNADAMQDLADYFERLSQENKGVSFYKGAANYWRYRAYCKGNPDAREWMRAYFEEFPGQKLEAVMHEASVFAQNDNIPGRLLNDLGYDFFDPERKYMILQKSVDELVEIRSESDHIPFDHTGFGMEEYYDCWFLDENMQPIPGVEKIHISSHDIGEELHCKTKNKAEVIGQFRVRGSMRHEN